MKVRQAATTSGTDLEDPLLLSHELRRPLAAMDGYLSMMLDGAFCQLPAELVRPITLARAAAAQMNGLIECFVTAARIDATPNFGPFLLRRLLQDAIEAERSRIEAKNLQLTEDYPNMTAPLQGDYNRLRVAISNVISNAVKYTPPHGEITVRVRIGGDWVEFEVADGGPGIPEGELHLIFERGYRSTLTRQSGEGGMGLGLYIARRIIEEHGGKLSAFNRPQAGSVFSGAFHRAPATR